MVNIKNSTLSDVISYDKKCIYYYNNGYYCSITFHVDLLLYRRKLKKHIRKFLNVYRQVVIKVVNDKILNEFLELCDKDEYYRNLPITNYIQYKNVFNLNFYKQVLIKNHKRFDIFMGSLKNIKANTNNILV